MYAAIWRKLPGGKVAKVGQAIILIALLLAAMHFFAFPTLASWLTQEDSVVANLQ